MRDVEVQVQGKFARARSARLTRVLPSSQVGNYTRIALPQLDAYDAPILPALAALGLDARPCLVSLDDPGLSVFATHRLLHDLDTAKQEAIRDTLGDFPLVGFFCNGEISHNRLYGYTGVLTLFL